MTHDYKRNGITDLFAALNVGTGEELTDCRKHHKGADVLRFFKLIDLHAKDLDIHVILDNLSAHKSPEVKKWLADPARARWHLHFIPTSSSWLNLVERWFKELTDRRLRRGAFTSVANLIDASEIRRSYPRQEPSAVIPLAGSVRGAARKGGPYRHPRLRTGGRCTGSGYSSYRIMKKASSLLREKWRLRIIDARRGRVWSTPRAVAVSRTP